VTVENIGALLQGGDQFYGGHFLTRWRKWRLKMTLLTHLGTLSTLIKVAYKTNNKPEYLIEKGCANFYFVTLGDKV